MLLACAVRMTSEMELHQSVQMYKLYRMIQFGTPDVQNVLGENDPPPGDSAPPPPVVPFSGACVYLRIRSLMHVIPKLV